MARIDSPRLAIAVDSGTKTAKCEVSCKVYFTAYEIREMREGLNFRTRLFVVGGGCYHP